MLKTFFSISTNLLCVRFRQFVTLHLIGYQLLPPFIVPMKYMIRRLFFLMMYTWSVMLALSCSSSSPTPDPITPPAVQTVNEVRGIWLTNVASTAMDSRVNIASAMQLIAANGFNVVMPVVFNAGWTLYPSQVMQREFGNAIDPRYTGRDVLAEVIAEARAHGLTVIPWFEYGFAASFGNNGGHIIAKYPRWSAIGTDGRIVEKNGFVWMNSLDTNVQNFMTSLIMEVVNNYQIDGIQGDDRLPAMPTEAGYDSATVARYRAETGRIAPTTNTKDAQWVQWRADKLTQYLARLRQTVKARKPDVLISMSPSPFPFGLQEYLQDYPAWMNQGLVDMMHPQLYRRDVPSYRTLVDLMVQQTPAGQRSRLSPGILMRVGTYNITTADIIGSIQYNRSLNIPGEIFFFFEGLRQNNNELGTALRLGPYNRIARFPKDSLLRPIR